MMAPLPTDDPWGPYSAPASVVLGFHGCDRALGEDLLAGRVQHLHPSENEYDWLGHGIYFWEGNPRRALDFARERQRGGQNSRGIIRDACVIGAIIDLGRCLNLMDASCIDEVQRAHARLAACLDVVGLEPPRNRGMHRRLDCAVIQSVHEIRAERRLEPYQSARGLFVEGEPLYPGAGFASRTHVELCVRDVACIRGYFRPIGPAFGC